VAITRLSNDCDDMAQQGEIYVLGHGDGQHSKNADVLPPWAYKVSQR